MAHDDGDHDRRGGHDLPSLGSGGKLTVKLLQRGESQMLAEIYASEDTGRKLERALRRGLIVHCYPGGYDTVSFTCEGARTPPEATTPETTTSPETTAAPEPTTPPDPDPPTTTPETTTPPPTPPPRLRPRLHRSELS